MSDAVTENARKKKSGLGPCARRLGSNGEAEGTEKKETLVAVPFAHYPVVIIVVVGSPKDLRVHGTSFEGGEGARVLRTRALLRSVVMRIER